MNKQAGCMFCSNNFPCDYQLISERPKHWLFVLNIDPQTDLHGMVVLKSHCRDLADENFRKIPNALEELGRVLNLACKSIKAVDQEIETVLITSLNLGENSQHLHFHLIPKRKSEKVRSISNPCEDGGGMFFMARKEIVVDTYKELINSTTNCEAEHLISNIREAQRKQIIKNVSKLKKKFLW